MSLRSLIPLTALVGFAMAGCTTDTGTAASPCPDDATVVYNGETYCVVGKEIIETGFMCPPALPHEHSGPGFSICSSQDGLPEGDIGAIGEAGGFGCPGIKIDVLFVVDNSTSMCAEQNALSDTFGAFQTSILSEKADLRVAVTTNDMGCPADGPTPAMGRFNTQTQRQFPLTCMHREQVRCEADSDCQETLGGPGEWTCRQAQTSVCIENPNGSINTSCKLGCTEDTDCTTMLDDPTAYCLKPSTDPEAWGCIVPPRVGECPDTLPPILEGDDLSLFPCSVAVGANQDRCFTHEQGLGASLAALEILGPNGFQAGDFNRPDAHLVVLYITDEDDCSTGPGETIGEDDFDTCALLNTTDDGGPLLPVDDIVFRLNELREGDSKVIVGVVTGDSLKTTTAERNEDRAAYAASKADERVCHTQTSICSDASGGVADYGSRYIEVAEAFGDDGIVANICAPEPIASLMDQLAARLRVVASETCGR